MRPHNYYDHPPACTCAQCTKIRLERNRKGSVKRMIDAVKGLLRGKRSK